ncbi:Natural resistance-associated macrophage domain containing protein [Tylopilus felleus]
MYKPPTPVCSLSSPTIYADMLDQASSAHSPLTPAHPFLSTFGYCPMLFVILLSGVMAVLFQVLSTRLGCVTGLDLAAHCRLLLHDHSKHPHLVRFLFLYPLYVLSELAIIATDLAELLGSAIGLTLLVPALPIWAGVLLTALDVFVFLLTSDRPLSARSSFNPLQVAAVFVSIIVLVINVNPIWSQAFLGFVPSKKLFQTQLNAIYTGPQFTSSSVLILPHKIVFSLRFLHPSPVTPHHSSFQSSLRQCCRNLFSTTRAGHDDSTDKSIRYGLRQNNPLSFIQAHMTHAVVDIIFSLLVVAVPINSAILITSVAVPQDASTSSSFGIFGMAALLFALALVFSGQAASVTATLAGQVVSEGFIHWSISPFLRRLVTRLLSLIPAMIVAMAFGRSGLNALLVASQVALSIVLPFVAFPLIFLTSSKTVMSVDVPDEAPDPTTQMLTIDSATDESLSATSSKRSGIVVEDLKVDHPTDAPVALPVQKGTIDFSNTYIVSAMAYAVWLVISVANVYGIVV